MSTDQTVNITANPDGSLAATPAKIPLKYRPRRGRHPEVTAGAFGNGRKHNGIKFRSSNLINRYA